MAAARTGLAALVAVLLVAGCGSGSDEGKAMTLDWDFSNGHRVADAPGFDTDLDSQDLRPISALKLTFPDGTTFSADGDEVRRVNPSRRGETVTDVIVVSQPRDGDGAYALAKRWARELGVPTARLDAWHAAGAPDERVLATDNSHTLGEGGPVPSIEIETSFQDDQPYLVTLTFFWPPQSA
jgi:hypothetical protein